MNRNNIYTVNPLYNGSTTQTTEDGSVQSGGTTIIYQQGGGTGLTDAQKQKLDGIQEGAEVNQNAYSKVRLNGSDALIVEAKNKTDILNMSGVYPIAIAINDNGGLDFTVSSDQSNTNSVVTQAQLKAALDQLEKDQYWKVDADGKLYTELDVYSHKEISAYGAGTGGGGTGGAGALYECADVLRDGDKVKGAEVGSVLSYNGTHWYAIPQSAIVPDLSGYATKSYVSQEINDLIGGAPGTLDTLKEIAEALGNNPNFATTVTEMINKIGLRVDDIEARVVSLEDMFEWDKSASASDSSLWRIKAKRDLFGVGEISAYGYSAGTVPTGAQYLYELKDVQLTDLATGQLLQYNGSKWVNIDKNAVGLNETELGRYLTNNNYAKKTDITWANLLNKPTTWAWADITGKPTTLAGYGITDAVISSRQVLAGNGLTGGGALTSDVTLSLNTIGTAGTYTKITTDQYGRVVSGTILSEGDIPTLQISKISGLQSALDSKLNISDFNTWFTINRDTSGNIVSIQANYNLFSVGEVSAYGLGGTQPSITTLAGLDDVNISNPQNKQALIYDSASGKWINGASVGGGNISLNGTVYTAVDGLITLPNLYEKVAGGTSSQFLKADGSVDGNLYLTQASTDSRYVLKTGDTMTGRLTAPDVFASTLRSNLLLTVGASNAIVAANRAELHLITPSDNPCDLWMGANNSRRWSITARSSGENYHLGIYNNTRSNWNVLFRDDINDFYVKTEVRSTFLVVPSNIAGGYNEGIRVCNGSNNWSNIQFGAQNAWRGMINGQWVVGKNPANYFQVCMAGTETSNTTRPSKGFSVDTNGYLHTGYISVEINTDNQGDYFYSSNDAFLRRSAWYAALSHLSQKQLALDLTSLDQNKWYPCIIGAPVNGGTPLRITLFNGLRGNKPTWGSHQQGFSLLLDYEVTGSGWGILAAIAKLNWYFGSYGGETAFGGRQQNTKAATEIIYLRGGGIYYYRTTNGQELTVQPNGYTWNSGSYNYSAPVKTSQDNSPIEKTFDQVYWAPATLRNTRTIWGQPFNGSQNVSGALSGATTITATGDITTSANIGGRSIYANGGWLYSNVNGCEIRIGSQNASYVHITNNKSRPYYMDNRLDISGHVIPHSANIYDLGESGKPWRQAYINNMHGSADAAGMLKTAYIGGQQPNPQTYFGSGTGLKVAMTGIGFGGPWSDTLWINGYAGNDVLSMCALHFIRNGTPRFGISTQSSNGTSYGTNYEVWTAYNSNKDSVNWSAQTFFSSIGLKSRNICIETDNSGNHGGCSSEINNWNSRLYLQHKSGQHLQMCNGGGNVAIGGISPDYKLNVSGDIRASSWIRTDGATGWYSQSYGGGIYMTDSDMVQVYNNKVLYNSGYRSWGIGGHYCGIKLYNTNHIGINLANAKYTWGIYSNQDGNMYIGRRNGDVNNTTGSYIVTITGSTLSVTGSVVASGEVTAYSDARLKSNIHTLDYRGRLIPRHYVKDGKQSIGFIAQEVQTLYPELVLGYDKSRPYLSLNYNGCTAVLSAQLNYVEDEVTMLKNKVRELEIKVSVLTEQLHSQAI